MKTVFEPSYSHEDTCRQAAKVFAGEYWFRFPAATKKLIEMLEEQGFLEPRGDSATVGRAIHEIPSPQLS